MLETQKTTGTRCGNCHQHGHTKVRCTNSKCPSTCDWEKCDVKQVERKRVKEQKAKEKSEKEQQLKETKSKSELKSNSEAMGKWADILKEGAKHGLNNAECLRTITKNIRESTVDAILDKALNVDKDDKSDSSEVL